MKERPIDANKLLAHFSISPSGERYRTRDIDNFLITVNLEYLQKQIADAPTLDCVSVIRCKSCSFAIWSDKEKRWHCSRKWTMHKVRERDYCSYGHRKTDM